MTMINSRPRNVTKNFHLKGRREFHPKSETEVLGRILEAERQSLLDHIRPMLRERTLRPPKPTWCDVHYKYEQAKEQIICLVFQDMEAAASGERLLR